MISFIAFVLVFGILVFVHELGHFLAAKRFGVRVDEFALGLPPRIWSKKKGETLYALNLIPIGGYCKLYGEDGDRSDAKDNLQNKRPWQKASIFAAGVVMNFVLAYILLAGFYLVGGQSIITGMNEHRGVINNQHVTISEVEKDSPAAKSGIEAGDIILKVNGVDAFYSTVVSGEVQNAKANGQDIAVTLQRGNQELTKDLDTYTDKITVDDREVTVERVGIVMENTGKIRAKWYMAPIVAAQELLRLTGLTISGVYDFFKTLVTRFRLSENVGGPVAIYQLTGTAAELGIAALVQIMIMLSIALGVFNILPFPALDGGHILFLGIEKIRGKEIAQSTKNLVNLVGFGLLLVLVAVITWGDLGRFNIIENLKGMF